MTDSTPESRLSVGILVPPVAFRHCPLPDYALRDLIVTLELLDCKRRPRHLLAAHDLSQSDDEEGSAISYLQASTEIRRCFGGFLLPYEKVSTGIAHMQRRMQ